MLAKHIAVAKSVRMSNGLAFLIVCGFVVMAITLLLFLAKTTLQDSNMFFIF